MTQSATKAILKFYADSGVDFMVGEAPLDNTVKALNPSPSPQSAPSANIQGKGPSGKARQGQNPPPASFAQQAAQTAPATPQNNTGPLATPEAVKEATKLALATNTLEELATAIQNFEGLPVKHMATQMVFADGDPSAKIMVIGEAPGADEDRQGKPFVGAAGQLLDKMLAAIDLSRAPEDGQGSAYISNILNWRPPGNRTPTPQEMQICLPFIEKHIALVKPKILFCLGSVSLKTITGKNDSITKMRGKWQDYHPQTEGLEALYAGTLPQIMPSYHPAFLLRQPAKKRQAWHDLLQIKARLDS